MRLTQPGMQGAACVVARRDKGQRTQYQAVYPETSPDSVRLAPVASGTCAELSSHRRKLRGRLREQGRPRRAGRDRDPLPNGDMPRLGCADEMDAGRYGRARCRSQG